MMHKNRSVFKSGVFSLFLIPLLSLFFFLVCSDLNTDREFHPMDQIVMDGIQYKADPVLYMKGGYVESKIMTSYFRRSDDKYYTKSEALFTGSQNYINSTTKTLAWEDTYENGLHVRRVYLDPELIEQNNASEIVISYDGDVLSENILYDKNGNVASRIHITDSETRIYGQGNKLTTAYSMKTPESGLGYFKEWYLNGQLKFEMYSDSLDRTQGLMTLYDEQGNIIEQELYENDKLIEKIK